MGCTGSQSVPVQPGSAAALRPYKLDGPFAAALPKRGDDLDSREHMALHKEARLGRVAAVKALLRAGAAVDAPDINGDTALHLAVEAGSFTTVQALLEAGAAVHILDGCGRTARKRTSFSRIHALIDEARLDGAKFAV